MHEWLIENPHIRTIRVAASDLNGVARGKTDASALCRQSRK